MQQARTFQLVAQGRRVQVAVRAGGDVGHGLAQQRVGFERGLELGHALPVEEEPRVLGAQPLQDVLLGHGRELHGQNGEDDQQHDATAVAIRLERQLGHHTGLAAR